MSKQFNEMISTKYFQCSTNYLKVIYNSEAGYMYIYNIEFHIYIIGDIFNTLTNCYKLLTFFTDFESIDVNC